MELAIAALRRGSRHLNLVAFDRGNSGGELFSHELQRDRPVPEEEDAVGKSREVAAHEYAVGEEGSVAVAKHIAHSQLLTQLTLHGNSVAGAADEKTGPRSISERGVEAICSAMAKNTSITSFSILSLTLKQCSVKCIADMIPLHPTLTSLSLINAGLDMDHCSALSRGLKLDILTTLDISRNDISGAGTELLCAGLRENRSLKEITLDSAGITPNGAKALAIVLIHHPTLAVLSVRSNALGDEGSKVLSSGLRENKSLTHLDVSMNRICDDGVAALCESMRVHPAMRVFNCRNNGVTDKGAVCLAELLATQSAADPISQLASLNIELNFVKEDGVAALIKAVHSAPSLTCLDVSGNPCQADNTLPGWKQVCATFDARRDKEKAALRREADADPGQA